MRSISSVWRNYSNRTRLLALAALLISAFVLPSAARTRMRQSAGDRDLTIVANQFAFQPTRIVVNAGDVVKITLIAEDRPHSFTVDAYRISRRATPGHSAVIEFCADRVGTYIFYCSLTDDDRCRGMKGELVVR